MVNDPRVTRLHKVERIHDGHNTNCSFCGSFIYHEARQYHVDSVGAMCSSCLDISYLIFKGTDSYVELTYSIRSSRAVRII